jgi:hypothetical protein
LPAASAWRTRTKYVPSAEGSVIVPWSPDATATVPTTVVPSAARISIVAPEASTARWNVTARVRVLSAPVTAGAAPASGAVRSSETVVPDVTDELPAASVWRTRTW